MPWRALAPLLLAAFPARAAAQAVDWNELSQRLARAAQGLKQAGCEVDLARLKLENLPPERLVPELEQHNVRFFGGSWFEMLWVLYGALGLPVEATPDEFRIDYVRATIGPQAAWYLPSLKSIVIDEAQYRTDALLDRLLVHELFHAFDDQHEGLEAIFAGFGPTTDGILLARAWTEGRAEDAADRVGGVTLRDPVRAAEQRSGGMQLHYRAGLLYLHAFPGDGAGGPPRPRSGEQLLHAPAKSKDEPTAVALPASADAGLAPVRDDVLGEMGLRLLLATSGGDPVRALEAGLGWDGDRLLLWKDAAGAHRFVWRIVFDRALDAEQLARFLEGRARGRVLQRANTLDWIWAKDESQLAALEVALPAPIAIDDPAAAASTAAIEEHLLAGQPHRDGEDWIVPEFGLRVRLVAGWSPSWYQGQAVLLRDGEPRDGFRANVTLREFVLPEPLPAARVLEDVKQTLAGVQGLRVLRCELLAPPATDTLVLEYSQGVGGRKLHVVEIQLLADRRKVAFSVTALDSRWSEVEDEVERLVAGLALLPPGAGAGSAR